MAGKIYVDYIGAYLTHSVINYMTLPTVNHLLDSSNDMGSKVDTADITFATPPVGTPGLCFRSKFVNNTPLSTSTLIDGMVQGTVIVRISVDAAMSTSYYVRLTDVSIAIKMISADNTSEEDILPLTSIWSGSKTLNASASAAVYADHPFYFAEMIYGKEIPAGARLSVWVEVSGFRSVSNYMSMGLWHSISEKDFQIRIPMVEEE